MNSSRQKLHTNKRNLIIAISAAILVVAIGYTLVLTKAAGFFASVDPANTSVSGNATLVADTSGAGQVLQFNAPGSTTPPSTSGPDLTKSSCITKPSACGYPDETNTGYLPTGLKKDSLGTVKLNNDGDFVIDQDGTVVDGKLINACVLVKAKNVTIKRSLLTGCKSYFNVRLTDTNGVKNDTANFLLEDSEIDGGNYKNNATIVDDNEKGGFVVRRTNIHNVADGPHPGFEALYEDNYIHDMYVCPDECHTDTIQSAGAYNVTIRHNTIINDPPDACMPDPKDPKKEICGGKNAVIRVATEGGDVNGFTIENNLMKGGNYAIQIRRPTDDDHVTVHTVKNIRIINNRIVSDQRFGTYDLFDDQTQKVFTTSTITAFSGNVRDDNLSALNTIE